jgi:hypothetical protein
LKGTGACSATITGGVTTAIAVYSAISPGAINTASAMTSVGTNPNVTIGNSTVASDGSGSITYQWRRTGTSSATLTGSNTTYALNSDATNYSIIGTYYFNRYAKDATCNTAWMAATGTYTLNVIIAPPSVSFMLQPCIACCYDGGTGAWVDCYVTRRPYPFDNIGTNTQVNWMGGSETHYATSDINGRANTAAITGSTGTSAVQICKNLGTGWYLPAYEEMVNMSRGTAYTPLNGRSGANVLSSYYLWSSSEDYNEGRYGSVEFELNKRYAVVVAGSTGDMINTLKSLATYLVHCVWRP